MDGEGEGEEGEEGGEISPMCESIGHRPFRGRCPKGKGRKGGRKEGREEGKGKEGKENEQIEDEV